MFIGKVFLKDIYTYFAIDIEYCLVPLHWDKKKMAPLKSIEIWGR